MAYYPLPDFGQKVIYTQTVIGLFEHIGGHEVHRVKEKVNSVRDIDFLICCCFSDDDGGHSDAQVGEGGVSVAGACHPWLHVRLLGQALQGLDG